MRLLNNCGRAFRDNLSGDQFDDIAEAFARHRLASESRLTQLMEALRPFAEAGELAIVSGRPPSEHVDANAFIRAINVLGQDTTGGGDG